MLKNRIAAVQMVSESLAASERAIDDALIASAELTLTVPKAPAARFGSWSPRLLPTTRIWPRLSTKGSAQRRDS